MNLERLRQETAADHHAVESAVPLTRQELTTAEYVQALQQIYGIVAAWEERSVEVAPPWLQPALISRQRRVFLEQDMAWFGITEKADKRPELPEMTTLSSLFGMMYVMEGSRLGGQLIARHVETALHLSEGNGYSYFRGNGNQTGHMWKEFCGMLKVRISEDETAAVVLSAKAMFTTFAKWMQGNPAMGGS